MRVLIAFLLACALLPCARSAECARSTPGKSGSVTSASYPDEETTAFYVLSRRMRAAYASGDAEAARLAMQALAMAERYPCNWNYGNVVHDANSILGLMALHAGRRAEAVSYLLASGRTPGSPQLNSFGPSLALAHELAESGEYEAVASYLESVRRFWKAPDMSTIGLLIPYFADPDPIATWIGELHDRRVPSFGAPFNANPP